MSTTDPQAPASNLPVPSGPSVGVDRYTGDASTEMLRVHLAPDAAVRRRVFASLLRRMNASTGGVS